MNTAEKRINTKDTLELAGIKSANTLRAYWKSGKFPQPVRTTFGTNGKLFWYQHEVEQWLEERRGATDSA